MSQQRYLQTFFKEKELPYQEWILTDRKGREHFIDSEVAIEFLLKNKPIQKKAADQIRMIDFKNGDVNHFLQYIAQGIVNTYT